MFDCKVSQYIGVRKWTHVRAWNPFICTRKIHARRQAGTTRPPAWAPRVPEVVRYHNCHDT